MGKATGRPVCDLLGGRARDRVDFAAYLFYKYEGAGGSAGVRQGPERHGLGGGAAGSGARPGGCGGRSTGHVRRIRLQVDQAQGRPFPPAEEVAAMLALRDAFGPDVPLRHDPNAIWSVETAIKYGKQMEGVLEYYEDPVRGQEAMAAGRRGGQHSHGDQYVHDSFEHLPGSIRLGSEDVILSDHHGWGGLRSTVELARICKTFGRGVSMHSNSHLGITLAAMVQVAAAIPNLDYACDTHYPWQSEEVIVGGPFVFDDGALEVSSEPGLGIELDRDALAQLHQQYLDCGLTERNDEIEMQKVNPGWKFEATRW